MPSTVRGMHGRLRPDIVLGDRYGTSCASELTDLAAQVLTRLGYSVSRNKPYAGGFITEHYGQPARGLHAMQIEINRCLYMDERTLEKTRAASSGCAPTSPRFVARSGEAFDARLPRRAPRRPNSVEPKKKGRSRGRGGPSLGRKRPRRACGIDYRTAII